MYLIFFRFFSKVIELFECRRGDPYMTASRNFVHFAHSCKHANHHICGDKAFCSAHLSVGVCTSVNNSPGKKETNH